MICLEMRRHDEVDILGNCASILNIPPNIPKMDKIYLQNIGSMIKINYICTVIY